MDGSLAKWARPASIRELFKVQRKKKPLVIKKYSRFQKTVTDEQIEGNQPQHINNGLNLPNIRFLEFSSLQETYQRQRDTKRQKMKA